MYFSANHLVGHPSDIISMFYSYDIAGSSEMYILLEGVRRLSIEATVGGFKRGHDLYTGMI